MASRSAIDNDRADRRRTGGAIPPREASHLCMPDRTLPSARPISLKDSPAFQRSHSSTCCCGVNPIRPRWSICTTSASTVRQLVLHRPVEIALHSVHRYETLIDSSILDSRERFDRLAPLASPPRGTDSCRDECAGEQFRAYSQRFAHIIEQNIAPVHDLFDFRTVK